MKWVIFFSWTLNIFLAWGVSQHYQLSELTFSFDLFLILAAFLSVILWPVYWIFSFSEQLAEPEEKEEELEPRAEIFIENIILQQNFNNISPLILKKSNSETDKIFFKVEKVVVGTAAKEELRNIKKQTQIKILSLLNDQMFAIEKLQEEMLMIVEMSKYLSDAEKMVLCHNIKQYITQKQDDLIL